jgi:hypothetical protein
MHTIHAIDRWSMSYMLSIDDACLCYRSRCMPCFRSMMHVTHVIDQWCIVMLLIDDACYMLSMMHAIFIDRWSILMLLIDDTCYMLSIDDVCICYRSTMHVLCYGSMMHNLWWCMLYMLSIDDACYMLSILDDACLCYRSTMHATCYRSMMQVIMLYMMHATCDRSMMHSIHDIYDDAYYSCLWWCILCYRSPMKHITHAVDLWYICCRSMMMHHIDLQCMLHMPLIDNVFTRATIDDAWYVFYRSIWCTTYMLSICDDAWYAIYLWCDQHYTFYHYDVVYYMLSIYEMSNIHSIDRWCILWCCMLCA